MKILQKGFSANIQTVQISITEITNKIKIIIQMKCKIGKIVLALIRIEFENAEQ